MVLVHLGERVRPVKFCGGIENLRTAIRNTFRDVLVETGEAELVLQVCCQPALWVATCITIVGAAG